MATSTKIMDFWYMIRAAFSFVVPMKMQERSASEIVSPNHWTTTVGTTAISITR
jgi:hypothetical protein